MITFISMIMLDVERFMAPDASRTVCPYILMVNLNPDLTLRLTDPSVKTIASSTLLCSAIIASTASAYPKSL